MPVLERARCHKVKRSRFTVDLRLASNRLNASYKRYTRNMNIPEYKETSVKYRNVCRKHVRLEKRLSSMDFCEMSNENYGKLCKYNT